VLAAEPGHFRAGRVGGELGGLAVEGFCFLGDGEVLAGDGGGWRSSLAEVGYRNCLNASAARSGSAVKRGVRVRRLPAAWA